MEQEFNDAALYDVLNTVQVVAPEGADPYAQQILPPEGVHRFRFVRRGKAEIRFSLKIDGKRKNFTPKQLAEFAEKQGTPFSQLASDPGTNAYATLQLIMWCNDPAAPWHETVSYVDVTTEPSRGGIGQLTYFLRRIGCDVPQSSSLSYIMNMAEQKIPEGKPEESSLELQIEVDWTGYNKLADGTYKYFRGMKKWPMAENPLRPGMHSQVLDDPTGQVQARLEIKNIK